MKLRKCEFCGTEFDAALGQCPLCGKAVQPGAAEPQPVMPAAYKPAGGHGGKFSKKKGGRFAQSPKKAKEEKQPVENPYKIPKWMMVTICVILGLAVLMGAAFAFYQLSWFPKFLSPSEPVSMQEQEAEVQPEQPAQEEPAPAAPTERQYMNDASHRSDPLEKRSLVAVADDQIDTLDRGQFPRPELGIASGYGDQRARILPDQPSYQIAAFLIGMLGYRTTVHDIDVGGLPPSRATEPAGFELARDRGCLRKVHLAAQRIESDLFPLRHDP